jgi:large subunit ribosomal protein L35
LGSQEKGRTDMPKMKTHSGCAKRFSRTSSGKLKRHKANKNHFFTNKTTKRKRQRRGAVMVDPSDASRIDKLLPYL